MKNRIDFDVKRGVCILRMKGKAMEYRITEERIWVIYSKKRLHFGEKMAINLTARQIVKHSLLTFPDMTVDEFRDAKSYMTGAIVAIVEYFGNVA